VVGVAEFDGVIVGVGVCVGQIPVVCVTIALPVFISCFI
jgi:hypothetical protein